jgi:hypothetical protein
MTAATKKGKKRRRVPWKAGASSGHITNLKQSILETFDIYGFGSALFKFIIEDHFVKHMNITTIYN